MDKSNVRFRAKNINFVSWIVKVWFQISDRAAAVAAAVAVAVVAGGQAQVLFEIYLYV